MVSRLKGWGDLTAIVGTKVYGHVPLDAPFPYVSLGAMSEAQDDAECITAAEISIRWDAWSRAIGAPEVLRIAEAVKAALHGYEPVLADNALVLLEHLRTDTIRDSDGLTIHAIIEFRALIEQP